MAASRRHGRLPYLVRGDPAELAAELRAGRPVLVLQNVGLGHHVAAVTGRPEQADYLKSLGAAEIVPRAELETASGKPLDPERWAGAIDAAGGALLGNLVTQLRYNASVACCGNAGGIKLEIV